MGTMALLSVDLLRLVCFCPPSKVVFCLWLSLEPLLNVSEATGQNSEKSFPPKAKLKPVSQCQLDHGACWEKKRRCRPGQWMIVWDHDRKQTLVRSPSPDFLLPALALLEW